MGKGYWYGLVAGAAAAGLSIACVVPTPPPSGDTETAPCSGCGTWYTVCPGSDSCVGGYISGYWTCKATAVNAQCIDYVGGVPGPGGCCTGGTPVRMSNTWTTITVMVGSGNCTFWVFPL